MVVLRLDEPKICIKSIIYTDQYKCWTIIIWTTQRGQHFCDLQKTGNGFRRIGA